MPPANEVYSGTTAGGTGTAHEVFADRLGSVIEVVEAATGTVVSRQRFDSFGLRTATGPLLQRYGFTGREHDAESGLIYFRARAYDPAVGTFLQRDPIGFAAGDLNLYAYVENNPFNWKDPSGLSPFAGNAVTTAGAIAVSRGLFGAFRQLLYALQAALILNVSGDTPDNPPDNPPDTGDCDPLDPNCNQCSSNGNSSNSTLPQHAYDIIDTWNGTVAKTGISSGKINAKGFSYRATRQVNAWNREPGNAKRYTSRITRRFKGGEGARQRALDYERKRANELRDQLDPDRHKCP